VGWRHVLLIAGVVVFLAITFKPAVGDDGGGYFSYLHSIVFDHDLDMTDEYVAAAAEHVKVSGDVNSRTITGLPPNQYSIGPAILSLPAYLIAVPIRPGGQPQFEAPFTTAYTLASLFYGLLALALTYRLLRKLSLGSSASLAAVVGIALGTPLLYYLVYSPSYSHTFSAFMVTLFVYLWWTRREQRSWRGWLLLGVVGGVMALVRWQDGPLMAITLLDLPRARWRILLLAPGTLVGFSPQLVVDKVIFGHWQPGAPTVAFDPFPGHYLDVLFSSLHGLFVSSPLLLAAVAGYWFVKNPALRAAFAICFLMQVLVIGSFVYWYGGFSVGMRFLINLTPFFAIGLAGVTSHVRPAIAWAAIGAAAAWGFLLVLSASYLLPPSVAPGYAGLVKAQVRALAYLPHLVQGYVARGLFGGLLNRGTDVAGAVVVLLLETVIVAAVVAFAVRGDRDAVPA
jgi:hypothetical protein